MNWKVPLLSGFMTSCNLVIDFIWWILVQLYESVKFVLFPSCICSVWGEKCQIEKPDLFCLTSLLCQRSYWFLFSVYIWNRIKTLWLLLPLEDWFLTSCIRRVCSSELVLKLNYYCALPPPWIHKHLPTKSSSETHLVRSLHPIICSVIRAEVQWPSPWMFADESDWQAAGSGSVFSNQKHNRFRELYLQTDHLEKVSILNWVTSKRAHEATSWTRWCFSICVLPTSVLAHTLQEARTIQKIRMW